MQAQAPLVGLEKVAMDVLFLCFAHPELAAEVILEYFDSYPYP